MRRDVNRVAGLQRVPNRMRARAKGGFRKIYKAVDVVQQRLGEGDVGSGDTEGQNGGEDRE